MVAHVLRASRTVGASVAACVALLLSGCGGGDHGSDRAELRALMVDAIAAFSQRDADALCERLSRRAKLVIAHAAHYTPPVKCSRDVARYFDWTEPYLGYGGDSRPVVQGVRLRGRDRAVVETRVPGAVVAVPATREDGDWRLDGLFDATLSRIQRRGKPGEERLMPAVDVPAVERGRRPLIVRDARAGDGRSCSAVEVSEFPEVSGGCAIEKVAGRMSLLIQTPFGLVRFSDCDVYHALNVDGDGRAWVVDFTIAGANPCFDAMPCWDPERTKIPWPARIERRADGGLRLRIDDVCLDTCVGRFEGRWDLDMVERRRGWRMRSASTIGRTGWRLVGALESTAKAIAIDDRGAGSQRRL